MMFSQIECSVFCFSSSVRVSKPGTQRCTVPSGRSTVNTKVCCLRLFKTYSMCLESCSVSLEAPESICRIDE